mmetsp:Transcript_41219/g.132739  ORF Transcript_41219/g.132739 Transcript_41219/m.132739 type:complete len:258 (-) Transcript_41219:720-1493(-)
MCVITRSAWCCPHTSDTVLSMSGNPAAAQVGRADTARTRLRPSSCIELPSLFSSGSSVVRCARARLDESNANWSRSFLIKGSMQRATTPDSSITPDSVIAAPSTRVVVATLINLASSACRKSVNTPSTPELLLLCRSTASPKRSNGKEARRCVFAKGRKAICNVPPCLRQGIHLNAELPTASAAQQAATRDSMLGGERVAKIASKRPAKSSQICPKMKRVLTTMFRCLFNRRRETRLRSGPTSISTSDFNCHPTRAN